MNRISTLLLAFAALFTVQSHAQLQLIEDFDTVNEPSATNPGCWTFSQMDQIHYTVYNPTSSPLIDYRITGPGGLATQPTTGSGNVEVNTPTLNITSTSFTVEFRYRLNAKIPDHFKSSKLIYVGLLDASGYTWLDTIVIDGSTPNPIGGIIYNQTFTLATTGAKKLVLRMDGEKGLGSYRVILDDFYSSASFRYTTNLGCNSAPVAVDDLFAAAKIGTYSNNIITNTFGGTDNEPNGETLTPSLVSVPAASMGTVTVLADGSFTFTPSPSFNGGTVSFTYRLVDNGFAPLTSNLATVTIEYPIPVVLPVKLMNFSGNVVSNKASLNWSVADNETGNHFEVLRSTDGKNYSMAGIVFVNSKAGAERYNLTDAVKLAPITYYKLKIVNKDYSVSYSNIILLKSEAATAGSSLAILQNPVEANLNFTYTSLSTTQSNVVIYNAAGVRLFSTKINMQKGANVVSFPLDSKLAPGTYFLEVANATERTVTKLIKK